MPHSSIKARDEYNAAYRDRNREKIRAANKARYYATRVLRPRHVLTTAERSARRRANSKHWPSASPERKRIAKARYRAKPTSRATESRGARVWNLRAKYGLTLAAFEAMRLAQDGKCAICGIVPSGPRDEDCVLHCDHDHTTNALRGLLCTVCNRGIGLFRDNSAICRSAADYLERTGAVPRVPGSSVRRVKAKQPDDLPLFDGSALPLVRAAIKGGA